MVDEKVAMRWRSSIHSTLIRAALQRGSLLAGAGGVLLLIGGSLFSAVELKIWGFPLLATALLFITIGLSPYKRLYQLQIEPNELILEEESLIFFHKKTPTLQIPLEIITAISYKEIPPLYGLCCHLQKKSIPKAKILHKHFGHKVFITAEGDLFLPYFSHRTTLELQSQLKEL